MREINKPEAGAVDAGIMNLPRFMHPSTPMLTCTFAAERPWSLVAPCLSNRAARATKSCLEEELLPSHRLESCVHAPA